MIEKLYTVEEVAELASVTGRTIRNYLKSGRLVGRKIGGQWRFPENEVQRLLTGGAMDAAADEDTPTAAPDTAQQPAPAAATAPTPDAPTPDAPTPSTPAAEAEAPIAAQSFGAPSQAAAPAPETADASPAAATPDDPAPAQEAAAAQRYVPPAPLPEAVSPPQAAPHQPVQTANATDINTSYATAAYMPPQQAVAQAPPATPQQPAYAPTYAPTYAAPEQAPPAQPVAEPLAYPAAYPQPAYAPEMAAPPPPDVPQAPPENLQQPYPAPPPAAHPVYGQPAYGMPGYPPAADHQAQYQAAQQQFSAGVAYPQPQQAPVHPAAQQPADMPTPAPGGPQVTYVVPAANQPPQPIPAAYHYTAPAPLPPVYPPSPSAGGYYAPVQAPPAPPVPTPEPPADTAVSANNTTPTSDVQAEPAVNEPQATAAVADSGLAHLSDVGKRVAKFVAEVHDCSHGPQICAVFDLHQPLSAARATSERLAAIAAEESDSGQLCQSFVEFDDRYYVARYTLFGTSTFLLRCLKLIG